MAAKGMGAGPASKPDSGLNRQLPNEPTQMSVAVRLESLPNELLDRIAFYLSLEDLRPYSLTCHRIRNISIRHLFRKIRLTYGLSDEELLEPEACLACYTARAQHVRDLHILTESKSFYHYNVQGCHGTIIREALKPFNQTERLGFFEYSESSWADFFLVVKGQLETKPKLRYLGLQPNFVERGRDPRPEPRDAGEPWLQEPLPNLQSMRLSLLAFNRKIRGPEVDQVVKFFNIVSRLEQVTRNLSTLILDGSLRLKPHALALASQPLHFPNLVSLLTRDLHLSGLPITGIVSSETLSRVEVLSTRRDSIGKSITETEILEYFAPFSQLEELRLHSNNENLPCSTCKESHRIVHVALKSAFEESLIIAQHLPRLQVVQWFDVSLEPKLFEYNINRSSEGSPNLLLKSEGFQKLERTTDFACEDTMGGEYSELEVVPCDNSSILTPSYIHWSDRSWDAPSVKDGGSASGTVVAEVEV